MNDADYNILYAQGTRVHEQVILDCANLTPDEEQLFCIIRHNRNPNSRFIEDSMNIDSRTRRRLEHGMRLKVAYIILEAIREYGENHK